MDTKPSSPLAPPGRLPLLGHALALARRPLELVQVVRSYGDVVKIHLGVKPAYFGRRRGGPARWWR